MPSSTPQSFSNSQAYSPRSTHTVFSTSPAGEANEVLSDASKRRELDHALRTAAGGNAHSSGRGGFSSYYGAACLEMEQRW